MSGAGAEPSMGIAVFVGLTVVALATQGEPEIRYTDPIETMGAQFTSLTLGLDIEQPAVLQMTRAQTQMPDDSTAVSQDGAALPVADLPTVLTSAPVDMDPMEIDATWFDGQDGYLYEAWRGPRFDPWQASVQGNAVRLRTRPSEDADILDRYYRGAPAWVYAQAGDWHWVRIGELSGWMAARYLAPSDTTGQD